MRFAVALSLLFACGEPPVAPQEDPSRSARPAEAPAESVPDSDVKTEAPSADASPAAPSRVARVLEVLQESPHYTYARMDACGQEAWVAGPRAEMEVGQVLEMEGGQGLVDFESKDLGRTFDALLMVDAWRLSEKEPQCGAAPPAEPPGEALRFGTIKQILGASSYTYLELDVCGETVWVAGPERKDLEEGGLVGTPVGMENPTFYSKSLNMTFEPIYFVDWIKRARSLPPCPSE